MSAENPILELKTLPDPRIAPANGAIEYIKEQKFRAALFNNTPYMGYPTDETDKLWSDLYNCKLPRIGVSLSSNGKLVGISKISEEEATKLPNPTLPISGTNEYVIELDVWHELHCLNDLRKLLYPERFGGLDALKDENGTIQRDDDMFRHWGQCPVAST